MLFLNLKKCNKLFLAKYFVVSLKTSIFVPNIISFRIFLKFHSNCFINHTIIFITIAKMSIVTFLNHFSGNINFTNVSPALFVCLRQKYYLNIQCKHNTIVPLNCSYIFKLNIKTISSVFLLKNKGKQVFYLKSI